MIWDLVWAGLVLYLAIRCINWAFRVDREGKSIPREGIAKLEAWANKIDGSKGEDA